jgi:hypothetical protein
MTLRKLLWIFVVLIGTSTTALAIVPEYQVETLFYDDSNYNGVWDADEQQVGDLQLNCNGSYYRDGYTDAWLYGTVTMSIPCNLGPVCDYGWYSLDGSPDVCLPDVFVEDIQCTPGQHDCGCPDPKNPNCPH